MCKEAVRLTDVSHNWLPVDPLVESLKIGLDYYPARELRQKATYSKLTYIVSTILGLDHKQKEKIVSDVQTSLHFSALIPEVVEGLLMTPDMPWPFVLHRQMELIGAPGEEDHPIVKHYNNIREILRAEEEKIVLQNKITYPDDCECHWVRFPALVSRIFVKFLQGGGRDYCSLCKNCKRFILAERKGRKQFCSGACRVAHKRMLDAGGAEY